MSWPAPADSRAGAGDGARDIGSRPVLAAVYPGAGSRVEADEESASDPSLPAPSFAHPDGDPMTIAVPTRGSAAPDDKARVAA